MALRSYPFDDPMPRIVPGEVIASTQVEPEPPARRPSPHPRPRPRKPDPAPEDPPKPARPDPDPTPGPPPPEPDTPETPPPADPTDPPSDPPVGPTTARTHSVERPARTEPEPGPRVAILTLREVRPIADYGGLHEAEDALVDALAAGLYRVVLSSARYGRPPFDRPALRRALNSSRLVRPYRIEHHGQGGANSGVDVLLVLARDLADAATLVGVPGWYDLARTVVVHIAVVTERDLRRYPELVVQLRRRADALFSGTEMPPLGHLRSERLGILGVVPPMLDVLAFPDQLDRERTIDVFSPGPRPPGQHRLLQHWANTHDGNYQHDVGRLGAITSHTQHRRIFTAMACRSRLFLTNFDQFDHHRHAGAHREVGSRFYDAMAAGCALLGDLPVGSRRFVENVAPARPLALPATAQRLPADILRALEDRAESERLGTAARAAALRRGDVAHRWIEMSNAAGLLPSPGIQQRVTQLAAQADQLTP